MRHFFYRVLKQRRLLRKGFAGTFCFVSAVVVCQCVDRHAGGLLASAGAKAAPTARPPLWSEVSSDTVPKPRAFLGRVREAANRCPLKFKSNHRKKKQQKKKTEDRGNTLHRKNSHLKTKRWRKKNAASHNRSAVEQIWSFLGFLFFYVHPLRYQEASEGWGVGCSWGGSLFDVFATVSNRLYG